MKKRIFTIFLVILLAVTNLTVCYADGIDTLTGIGLEDYNKADNYEFTPDNDPGKEQNDPTWVEETGSGIIKVVINIISFIPSMLCRALLELIKLIIPTMDTIIFNEGASIWNGYLKLSYFDLDPKGLANSMLAYVSIFYQAFRYVALIGFIVAIACIAVKMILSSVGKQKAQYKDALKKWLLGLVLLVVGHWIMIYSIYFSDFLVKIIVTIKNGILSPNTGWDALAGKSSWLTGAFAGAIGDSFVGIIDPIIALIAIIVFAAMNLKIFKVYLERVVVVGVLIILFPIVTVFYVFEKSGLKRGSTFESWLRTFMDQVFIQPVHAITLTFVIMVLNALDGSLILQMEIIGPLIVLMVLNMMFSIENVVKRVFAISGAGLGQPINPMGAVMAGVGMGAPALRHGAANYRTLRNNGATRLQALRGMNKSAGTFLWNQRGKHLDTALGVAGIQLPKDLLNGKPMNLMEQKRTAGILRVGSKKIDNTGNKLFDSYVNMSKQMDPDIFSANLAALGLTDQQVRRIISKGPQNPTEDVKTRLLLATMADPNLDINSFKSTDGMSIDGTKVDSLGLSAAQQKRAVKKGRTGSLDNGDFVKGFRGWTISHADDYAEMRDTLGLTDSDVDDVLSGSGSSEDKLKVKAMIEGMLNSDVSMNDLMDDSGHVTAAKLQAVRISEKARESKARTMVTGGVSNSIEARAVLSGYNKADSSYFKTRLADADINPTEMKIFIETGNQGNITEEQLRAVMAGLNDSELDLNNLRVGGDFDTGRMEHLYDLNTQVSTPNTLDYQMSVLTNAMNTGSFDSTSISAFNDYIQAMPSHYQDALQEVNSYNYLSNNEINEQFMQDVINGVNRNPDDIAAAQLVIQKLLNKI